MNRLTKKIGYFFLLIYFPLISLHFWSSEVSYYYKEIFGGIFLLLTIPSIISDMSLRVRKELFYLFLFIVYLFIAAIFIPNRNIYGMEETTSLIGLKTSPRMYVLRNAVIYLPVILFIFKSNLSFKEIRGLLEVISIFGIISIISFLLFHKIASFSNLFTVLLSLGGDKLQYNSYIPYLTFPFASSAFLAFNKRNIGYRSFYISLAVFIFLFIVISTSRQSILFCIITVLVLSILRKKFMFLIINIIALSTFIFIIVSYSQSNYDISEKLLTRTTSVSGFLRDDTNRIDTAIDGIERLSAREILLGAGVTSVINSGPHNDFIRWIQRIGIVGAFLAFWPIFIAFFGSYKLMMKYRTNYSAFIFISIFFTVYISFFGYPREDAYQAPFVWLGFALWLSAGRLVEGKK